jgi:diketogulonate reductase-like aldo/keto reductase
MSGLKEYVERVAIGTYKVDKSVTKDVVLDALKHNIRRIDTANLYKNEAEVGEAIKECDIPREDLHITTKVHPRYATVKKAAVSIERSLESLGTYADTLLIHRPDVWGQESATHSMHIEHTWKILEAYKLEGSVRKIGVSNFTEKEIEHMMSYAIIKPYVNQICINDTKFPTEETIACCKKYDIKIEGYSPFGGVGGPLISDTNTPVDLLKKRLELADYVVFGGSPDHSVKSLF